MMVLEKYKLLKFVNTSRDFDYYFQLVNDENVMSMITERAIEFDEARKEFKQLLKNNAISDRFGYYKILDSEKRAFIGLAKLEITRPQADIAELGYIILPEFWGNGIASQIASHLVQYGRSMNRLKGLTAIIDPLNLPSRKILIKNGFQSRGFKDFDGLPGEILELPF